MIIDAVQALSPELKAKVDAAKRDRLARESITETLNVSVSYDVIFCGVWREPDLRGTT